MLGSGSYGCVYRPGLGCDGKVFRKKNLRENYVTKLQVNNSSAQNEYRIAEKIREIPNYDLYFVPAESMCSVKIKKNAPYLKQCSAINKKQNVDNDYVLLKMLYKNGERITTYFANKITSKREKVSMLLDAYLMLLYSIELLVTHELIHFDLHSSNVHYHIDTGTPLIIDFGLSLSVKDMTDYDLKLFGPSAEWWCLDIDMIALWSRRSSLYDFTDEYMKGFEFLDALLTVDEMDALKVRCAAQINRNKDMTKEDSMKMLWSYWHTWDNFSISVLMLKLIIEMFHEKGRENQLIELFIQLLLDNIDPNPEKRHSIDDTRKKFKELFYSVKDPKVYIDMINFFQELS